jgi:phage FluMu protein Com
VDETSLRLDGNALAGSLGEIFVHEMTSARVKCARCGRIEPVGAEHVYTQAPGAVLRCRHCENVLMVLADGGGRLRLAFQGCTWLEVPQEP